MWVFCSRAFRRCYKISVFYKKEIVFQQNLQILPSFLVSPDAVEVHTEVRNKNL